MMLTESEWGLVYLCWVIAFGSLVATAFTLRRFFEIRRQHGAAREGLSQQHRVREHGGAPGPMSYYKVVLQPDEEVLVIGRLHWSIYGRGMLLLVGDIALLASGFWLSGSDWQRVVLIAVGAVALLLLLWAWIRRRLTEIVVTNRRVIFKRGVLWRHTAEMNVSKIEAVDVEQSLAGRIWGYGTLLIRATGSGLEPLVGVGSPTAIRNAIVVG